MGVQRLAAVLAICSLGALQAAAVKELSGWEQGMITHYGGVQDGMQPSDPSFGTKEGACGYGMIPKDRWPYFSVAALSSGSKFAQEGPLHGCGQCFQIQCKSGMNGEVGACIPDSKGKPKSILVMISDVCPECGNDHMDVQSLAFAKLADPGIGRVKVTYRRIECTPPDDMKVSVMDFVGSNGWLRLAVDDTGGRGAVESVQVKGSSSGSWLPMTNSWGAVWELGSAPAPPLDFKIVTDNGEEAVASSVIKQNGGISAGPNGNKASFGTGVQFSITDPAVMTVRAASGENDPMVATSDTPGNGDGSSNSNNSGPTLSLDAPPDNSSSSNSGGSTSSGCNDVTPPGSYTCAQQKDWGKCQDNYILQGNYCAATCGRCGGRSTAGTQASPTTGQSPPAGQQSPSPSPAAQSPSSPSPQSPPQVRSFSGPSQNAGRKLLQRRRGGQQ